jgi:hypothetical protein
METPLVSGRAGRLAGGPPTAGACEVMDQVVTSHFNRERVTRIELAFTAWEAFLLVPRRTVTYKRVGGTRVAHAYGGAWNEAGCLMNALWMPDGFDPRSGTAAVEEFVQRLRVAGGSGY